MFVGLKDSVLVVIHVHRERISSGSGRKQLKSFHSSVIENNICNFFFFFVKTKIFKFNNLFMCA